MRRFIIYGAGGIGCVIGGHLFRRGYEVVLIGNAHHMDSIRQNGLKLVTGDQTFSLRIPTAKGANEIAHFGADDILMLCAKSQHTLKCLGQLKRAGAPNTLPIFCCQNSIWNEPMALRVFNKIYPATISIDAIFLTPGEIINPMTGRFGFLEIGCYPQGTDALCHYVAAALQRAGFSAIVNAEVMKSKAAKCLINLGNALYAITDGTGDLHPFTNELQREAKEVWSSAGIEWEDGDSFWKRRCANSGTETTPVGYEKFMKKEGGGKGSSWQSLERRTGSIETEYLNGDVVTLGRMLGIQTPYNELLWCIADEMARNGEKPGKFTADELMGMVRK